MSQTSAYVSSFVEESLGLARGSLDPGLIPQRLANGLPAALRGTPPDQSSTPIYEEAMMEALASARRAALAEDGYFVRKARWPDGARFAACLTHDVDNIARPRSHLWKTRARFGSGDVLAGVLGLGNPYDNVALIASREKAVGFESSFYFLTSNYPLEKVRKTALQIRADGWDIGLHGDFGTHDSLQMMNEAASRFSEGLGFRPTGLREHYLKFDFAKSWSVMSQAGFQYDTTVGTNDRLGFKVGLCSPFNPPDENWKPMPLLELPLVLMDTTLWGYLKKTEDEGLADFLSMMKAVEKVEGLFTLLWHQEAVRMKGGRIYWRLLEILKQSGCYVGTGAQVAKWWSDRALPLVVDGKLIRLAGDPPKDLVLELSIADGRQPVARSATIESRGAEYAVRPTGPDFQLEVL